MIIPEDKLKKPLLHQASYINEDSNQIRHVFKIDETTFLVVKHFGSEKPKTVKIWSMASKSLEDTISRWNTNVSYDASSQELEDAISTAADLVSRLALAL